MTDAVGSVICKCYQISKETDWSVLPPLPPVVTSEMNTSCFKMQNLEWIYQQIYHLRLSGNFVYYQFLILNNSTSFVWTPKQTAITSLYNINLFVCTTDAEHVYCAAFLKIPVVARSKSWLCGRSFAGIVASNPAQGHRCLSVVSVVFSVRSLWDELITRQEESNRELYVWLWSRSHNNWED